MVVLMKLSHGNYPTIRIIVINGICGINGVSYINERVCMVVYRNFSIPLNSTP
jgi:hypothetical protein